MAKYFTRDMSEAREPGTASPNAFRGHQPALSRSLPFLFDGQDRVVGASRRIIGERSSIGQRELYVTERDDTNNQVTDATSRISYRGIVSLTPGHLPVVSVCWLPAGRVSNASGTVGLYGEIEVRADFGSGGSASETMTFPGTTAGSGTAASQEPQGSGALARVIAHAVTSPLRPGPYLSASFVRDQCQHISVEITVTEKAAARILDVCIYEEPIRYTLEADDDPAIWYAHMAGSSKPPYPFQKAIDQASDGDPRFGTHLTHDIATNQRRGLGPCLVRWSAWDDFVNDASPDDEILTPFYRNRFIYNDSGQVPESPVRYNLLNGGVSGYVDGGLGFQVSTGGYSRNFRDSHSLVKRATIPVHCHVYVGLPGEGPTSWDDVRIELATSRYSSVTIVPPSGTHPDDFEGAQDDRWISSYGHLEVGINPEHPSILQPLVSVFGTDISRHLQLYAIVIEKADNFATQLIPSWIP